jgi:nicotinate-nucleotide--dimethylbenzimidazole phosphoribosyltransferase
MWVQRGFGFATYYFNLNNYKMTATAILQEELQQKIDFKTKPVGALGRLEEIALQAGQIQNTLSPQIIKPHIVVFAADHGIAATGLVNPYPQAVTAQMVLNFINGGAAINVFCRQNNIELKVVDCGVNYAFEDIVNSKQFIAAKIGNGTKNYLEADAMSEREALYAIEKGKEIVQAIAANSCNTIGFGEMGIGNTSSASLLMCNLLQLPIKDCVGRGTGVNNEQLDTKIETLQKVYAFHQLNQTLSPLMLLQKVGGYEIAMMAGAYLEAAKQKMIIVVDGFIATAALLIASKMNDAVLFNCIFAHSSGEQGHEKMLHYLNAKPLLQLQMRLGEGTGAALAIPLIQSAVNFLSEMASFETAGVDNKA